MLDSVEWVRAIFWSFPILKYLLVFLGTALGGEIFLITFAFLAAQGMISLYALLPLSFLGTYASDTMWFLIGRTLLFNKVTEHRFANPAVYVITETIQRISRGSYFLALVFAKFLFGTRVVTIVYTSKTGLSLNKFLYYNAYAVFLWAIVVIPIGYVSGLGFTYLAEVLENIYAAIGFLLLFLVLIVVLQIWLKKIFSKPN